MRMCPHPNIAFSSARIRCDAADRGSRVRHHPPASGGHPAREKHVLADQKRRRKGEDPLRRRHTEGQQQSKDRESARARGGWGGWCAGLMCVPPPTNRMSKIPERVVEKQLGRPHSSSSKFSSSSVRSAVEHTARAHPLEFFATTRDRAWFISKVGIAAGRSSIGAAMRRAGEPQQPLESLRQETPVEEDGSRTGSGGEDWRPEDRKSDRRAVAANARRAAHFEHGEGEDAHEGLKAWFHCQESA